MTWNNQNCAEKGAKITLLALYEKTIYQNEKNGFCIFRMTSEDTGIPKELGYGRDHKIHFSVIGYYLPPIRNSMLALTGAWENSRYDTYPALALKIELEHIRVFIENEMLYHALLLLPKKRLEIIILSFFADMTDKEIGKTILMPKSSVQYNRNVALQ